MRGPGGRMRGRQRAEPRVEQLHLRRVPRPVPRPLARRYVTARGPQVKPRTHACASEHAARIPPPYTELWAEQSAYEMTSAAARAAQNVTGGPLIALSDSGGDASSKHLQTHTYEDRCHDGQFRL